MLVFWAYTERVEGHVPWGVIAYGTTCAIYLVQFQDGADNCFFSADARRLHCAEESLEYLLFILT